MHIELFPVAHRSAGWPFAPAVTSEVEHKDIPISYETVQEWEAKFAPVIDKDLREQRI